VLVDVVINSRAEPQMNPAPSNPMNTIAAQPPSGRRATTPSRRPPPLLCGWPAANSLLTPRYRRRMRLYRS